MASLLIISFFSCFVGNGFSPIHFFICSKDSFMRKGVYGYILIRLITSFLNGSLIFPSVWFTFLAFLICLRFSNPGILHNCFLFYFLTNTFCFFEMSILYGYYPFSLYGYLLCMVAGIPFAIRSLIASGILALIFSLREKECLCLA